MRDLARTTRSCRSALRLLGVGAAAISTSAGFERTVLAGPVVSGSEAPDATSWPSFRATPDQRGISRSTLAEKPELKWELASPDGWVAAVAIVGEFVYALALAGYLHCLNLKTVKEIGK